MAKHKSGYSILKEKMAKLESKLAKRDAQIAELEEKYKHDLGVHKSEADSWHEKYKREHDFHVEAAEKLRMAIDRIEFLLDHAPFWVKWLYEREFEKGGSK